MTDAAESRQQVPHSSRCLRQLWLLLRHALPSRGMRELRVPYPYCYDLWMVQERRTGEEDWLCEFQSRSFDTLQARADSHPMYSVLRDERIHTSHRQPHGCRSTRV